MKKNTVVWKSPTLKYVDFYEIENQETSNWKFLNFTFFEQIQRRNEVQKLSQIDKYIGNNTCRGCINWSAVAAGIYRNRMIVFARGFCVTWNTIVIPFGYGKGVAIGFISFQYIFLNIDNRSKIREIMVVSYLGCCSRRHVKVGQIILDQSDAIASFLLTRCFRTAFSL